MILSKMLVNQIATYLTKHFKLDKMMAYVFDKNELDAKVEQLEKRIDMLENFKCNDKKEEDNG